MAIAVGSMRPETAGSGELLVRQGAQSGVFLLAKNYHSSYFFHYFLLFHFTITS